MTPEELQQLVDEERIDELFEAVPLEDMAEAWWRYALATGDKERNPDDKEDPPDWWAVEVWFVTAFQRDEARRRAAILALIDRAPAHADLGYVGAGPLADFIYDNENRLLWIEEQAARSTAFRRALANVWLDPEQDAFFDRVERAAGVALKRPLPWPEGFERPGAPDG